MPICTGIKTNVELLFQYLIKMIPSFQAIEVLRTTQGTVSLTTIPTESVKENKGQSDTAMQNHSTPVEPSPAKPAESSHAEKETTQSTEKTSEKAKPAGQ